MGQPNCEQLKSLVTISEQLLARVNSFLLGKQLAYIVSYNKVAGPGADHLRLRSIALVGCEGLPAEWHHATNIGFNSSGRVMYVLM